MANARELLPQNIRDRFKYEVAEDLNLLDTIAEKGWGDMPTRDLGRIGGTIGGNMVRVMIRHAEQQLALKGGSDPEE